MPVSEVAASQNLHISSSYGNLGAFRQARTCVKDPIVTPAGDSLIGTPPGVLFIQSARVQEETVGSRGDAGQGQVMDTQHEAPPKAEVTSEMTALRHQESDLCI